MAKNNDDAKITIIALGALLAAIWLGSKKRCPHCGEENDRLAANCRQCGQRI